MIDNEAGGTFDIQNDAQINGFPILKNEGLLKKTGVGGTTSLICNVINTGTINVASGILDLAVYTDEVTGTPVAKGKVELNGGTLKFDSAEVLDGGVTGSGTIQAPNGVVNQGELEPEVVDIFGDLINQADQHLGLAPGVTTIHGNFSQGAAANLFSDLRGTNAAAPEFGQLIVTGSATLAGKLTVSIENGYAPAPGAHFQILSGASRSGTFDTLNVPAGITVNYSNTGVFLVVTGAVPVQILPPQISTGCFNFGFNTISNRSYTIQSTTNLANPNWILFSNFTGNGSLMQFAASVTNGPLRFFRVSEP